MCEIHVLVFNNEGQSKRKKYADLLSSEQMLSELLSLTSLLLLLLWMLNGLPEMDANAGLIVVLIVSVRVLSAPAIVHHPYALDQMRYRSRQPPC